MRERPLYPSRPWRSFLALLLSLAGFAYAVRLWQKQLPLVASYTLPSYIRLALPEIPGWDQYRLLFAGNTLATAATPGDLVPKKVTPQNLGVTRELLREWLQHHVYGGQPLYCVLLWPEIAGLALLSVLMSLAIAWDRSANRESRDGRLIRGPRLLSHWEWNLRTATKRKDAFYIETR